MEDPVREAIPVLKKLVNRPTYKSLADTLRQYFTEDVAFYHIYGNVRPSKGLSVYIPVFQLMLLLVNYQDVEVHDLVYDEKKNLMVIRMTVRTKPWIFRWRTLNLTLLTELEFRDTVDENSGKVLKKIKVQRDYFLRSPLLQLIPVVGDLYDSDKLWYIVGEVSTTAIGFIVHAYNLLVPAKLRGAAFEFWREFLQVPLNEQYGVSMYKAME
ncbi:hypothetical protein R1sor_008476 [Riccia sorocarpa]|uniref:SigF-like NTF2-like domain-containing protein n=1 Tax=Riccia sorocarpa TaxID=122646 RepID=A0ABD3HX51_9MARC